MLSKNKSRYFAEAINSAMESPCHVKHGAVIISGGSVMSTGCNNFGPSDISVSGTRHAEDQSIYAMTRGERPYWEKGLLQS
jgi:deoxycytidylate deaminase